MGFNNITKRRQTLPNLTINGTAIQFSMTAKFLGIIFDSGLTWRYHTNSFKTRCESDLQLFWMIAPSKTIADYSTIKKLYLTQPKMNYGCFLYSQAAKTRLEKLDRIQTRALKTTLGALGNSQTFKIEVEANVMPLKLERKKQLIKYRCRAASIDQHPI